MRTVLMNIRDDFAELCRLVPVDPSIAPDDPSASGVDCKWILLRAPWELPLMMSTRTHCRLRSPHTAPSTAG